MRRPLGFGSCALAVLACAPQAWGAEGTVSPSPAWWVWPSALFVVTFLVGMVAVLAGLGGGTLFVPIVSGFFPFHLDFVRAAGLLVALSGALAAGPQLLTTNLANLRLAMPVALVASASAAVGAMVGLALSSSLLETALGVIVMAIVVVVFKARRSDFPEVREADGLSRALAIGGAYHEASIGKEIGWKSHRTWVGLVLFVVIGLIGGIFGIGAGWANVPVLNLVMGVPLKVAVGTSILVLAIASTSAVWIYLNQGTVLPILVVPSMVGMMLGSLVGVEILARARPATVRWVIIVLLLLAGARAFLKGLGVWP